MSGERNRALGAGDRRQGAPGVPSCLWQRGEISLVTSPIRRHHFLVMNSRLSPIPIQLGDKVVHTHNSSLGPGIVEAITPTRLRVHFPRSGETLEFSRISHPFMPFVGTPEMDPSRWFEHESTLAFDRLARLEVDSHAAFRNRLDALELLEIREAGGLGSFLGGRIEIFPHQFHVAECATRSDPVRWLLADEVGLGKTVEACLITNHLLRTHRVERVLIVAPRTLVVQWLGELWRKFHQVFVLIDDERRRDVQKEMGPELNPFDAFPRGIVALEDLVEKPDVVKKAREADLDLLVVDEAHRLRRDPGSAGSATYRALAPLTERAEHVLLLTATPLEADVFGFRRLLELLHPAAGIHDDEFEAHLRAGDPLPPCTSATRRVDIGGLPPRVAKPIDLVVPESRRDKERELRNSPATNAAQIAERTRRFERFLLEPEGPEDFRITWLAQAAKRWLKQNEKTLIFVHRREALTLLKTELEFHTSRRVAVFHEDLSPEARDLEVARFADSEGPGLLIATESGGEGRNFQFAKRLVLFDLPWEPAVVEQRIGRLDRIDRREPVRIVYFRPDFGFGAEVAALLERLGVFQEPLGALDRELGGVADAVRRTASDPSATLDIDGITERARGALEQVHHSVYHDLHRNPYRMSHREPILARIPRDLEKRTMRVVLEACRQYGFTMENKGPEDEWYLEFGGEATVETLHGVPQGTRSWGTFSREVAVRRETLDFFAGGHPLVEAVLSEVVDGTRGQVALLECPRLRENNPAFAVLMISRESGQLHMQAFDERGTLRPDIVEHLRRTLPKTTPIAPAHWEVSGWKEWVSNLVAQVDWPGDLAAVAGIKFAR